MKKSVFFLTFLVTSGNALAGELSVGAITSYSPAVYKGLGTNIEPFPMIGYEGSHVYLRGTSAGYSLRPQGSPLNLIFGVAYDPRTLKPEDSSNVDIKKLDERKAGVLGGATIQNISQIGLLEFSIGTDIANNHNGLYAETVWKLPIINSLYTIIPEVGYSYNSKKLNNHLYGVSSEESAKTNFDEFDAGYNGMFFVGLNTQVHLFRNVTILSSIRYSNLDSGLSKSPIIDSSNAISATLGFNYSL